MINFQLLLCFSILTLIHSEEISKPLNPNSISYHVEFEVLSYENPEGRLASGECCSGYKSTLGHGICRGGSSSCNPYFKVCMSHQQDPQRSTIPVDFSMPVERRSGGLSFGGLSAFRSELKPIMKKPPLLTTRPPQTRQSLFKGIFNRIVGSFSRLSPSSPSVSSPANNSTPLNRHGINKIIVPGSTSNAQCTIAYWSTENEPKKKGVIKLRATIPIVNMVRGFQADLKSKQQTSSTTSTTSTSASPIPPSTRSSSSSNSSSTVEPNPLSQKVILLVEIWHKTNAGHDKLITRHLELRNTTLQLLPLEDDTIWEIGGPNYGSVNTSTSGIKFRYRWRITGSLKYSSSTDPNDVNNNVIADCPPGFRGDDCSSPVCKTGCHSSHGYCNEPNECKCKFGWTGEFCSLCVPMPGCIHGSCSKPFECRCEEGWSGMFCDKPSCKLGCHPQNGYCEHPGECRCRFGYKGDNCTECATMPGCQNGDCENPLDCNCFKGWTGLFCNIPVCSEGCDLEHGWCRRPNECRCRVGWSGSNCSDCVPYPGCKMGNCTQPWTCDCQPGWGGIDCTEKLDYCELNANPCLNGGTCISVEKNDGSFICSCNLGFEGKRCEKTK